MQRIPLPFKCFLGWYDPSGLPCQLLWKLFLQHQPQPLLFNFTGKARKIYYFLQCQPHLLQFNFTDKAGKIHCFLQCQPLPLQFNFTDKAGRNHCFLQCQSHLLQQTFTKDGVLNILLVIENEAWFKACDGVYWLRSEERSRPFEVGIKYQTAFNSTA